jgi:hypothetical protein
MPVILKRSGERVKSTHSNGPGAEAKNHRTPTKFHVDSAKVRVLEFIELVSSTKAWRKAERVCSRPEKAW